MNTYILYVRYQGRIERKYESACNEFEATCQAMRYFKSSQVVKLVRVN